MTISIATKKEDNSKYVPVIDLQKVVQAEWDYMHIFLVDVARWAQTVTGTCSIADEDIIDEIAHMVLENDYRASGERHIEFINFAYCSRHLAEVDRSNIDIDMFTIYLEWIYQELNN